MIIEVDDNQQLKKQSLKQAQWVVAATHKGSELCRSPSNQGQTTWQACD